MPKKIVPKSSPKPPQAAAAVDRQRRTCLVLDVAADPLALIRLDVENGLDVTFMPRAMFGRDFTVLPDYPAERAARLYAGYARTIGATETALDALGRLTPVTEEEKTMALAKKNPAEKTDAAPNETATLKASLRTGTKKTDLPAHAKVPPKAAAKASAKDKPAAAARKAPHAIKPLPTRPANPVAGARKPSAPAPAKPAVKKAPAAKAATGDGRGRTAAEAFRELLRAGGLTDDQIFAKVQKEFNLDDKKRGYVSWYRNDMCKQGEKVPDAKK